MFLLRRASLVLLICCLWFAPLPGHTQNVTSQDDLLLRDMTSLGAHASFHTDFTFDNPMLRELAGGLPNDREAHRIVGNLDSITVHIYRYPKAGLYNPSDLISLRNHYRGPGWKHLIAAGSDRASRLARTDLWIRYRQGNVEAMTLLLAEPKILNVVEIKGKLSPIELLHLRGHFGIPRFQADHFTDDNWRQFLAEGH